MSTNNDPNNKLQGVEGAVELTETDLGGVNGGLAEANDSVNNKMKENFTVNDISHSVNDFDVDKK